MTPAKSAMLTRVCLSAVAFAFAACNGPVESRVALSEPGSAAYDSRILGDWYVTEKDFTWHLGIKARKDGDVFDILGAGIGYSEGKPVRWMTLTAYPSLVDGRLYYNVQRNAGVGDDYGATDTPPGYIVTRAELIGDDSLQICFLHKSLLDALIEKGELAGREIQGAYGGEDVPYLLIEEPRDRLAALIGGTPPDELFDCPPEPLRRLPPTEEE